MARARRGEGDIRLSTSVQVRHTDHSTLYIYIYIALALLPNVTATAPAVSAAPSATPNATTVAVAMANPFVESGEKKESKAMEPSPDRRKNCCLGVKGSFGAVPAVPTASACANSSRKGGVAVGGDAEAVGMASSSFKSVEFSVPSYDFKFAHNSLKEIEMEGAKRTGDILNQGYVRSRLAHRKLQSLPALSMGGPCTAGYLSRCTFPLHPPHSY